MTLYLLPNVLEEHQDHKDYLPANLEHYVATIDGLIAESEKSARAFLKRFSFNKYSSFREVPIKLLNEHTSPAELKELVQPLIQKQDWGLISDCGLPCMADPGASLVALARRHNLPIKVFSGPSSIIMGLMLSGLMTQRFAFHGYLPREPQDLLQKIKDLDQRSLQDNATQIFIEAPYRNQKILETLLKALSPKTLLAVACDLTLPSELVVVLPVSSWSQDNLDIFNKRPAVFLISHVAKVLS